MALGNSKQFSPNTTVFFSFESDRYPQHKGVWHHELQRHLVVFLIERTEVLFRHALREQKRLSLSMQYTADSGRILGSAGIRRRHSEPQNPHVVETNGNEPEHYCHLFQPVPEQNMAPGVTGRSQDRKYVLVTVHDHTATRIVHLPRLFWTRITLWHAYRER